MDEIFTGMYSNTGTGFRTGSEESLERMASCARLLYTAPESQLRFLCGEAFPSKKKSAQVLQLLLAARKQDPERIRENLDRAGIRFSCFPEAGFPARLRTIPDPPFGLYCRGKLFEEASDRKADLDDRGADMYGRSTELYREETGQCDRSAELRARGAEFHDRGQELFEPGTGPEGAREPAAAIIGARLASGYGREQARRFSRRLSSRGITIISGMAMGIDGIAQKAALDAGGKTCAVLGCGVDICYPEENRDLYERLLKEGGLISEYPPGMPPQAKLFPQRNRIISGLSDLVLVIEARKQSGTLITVDMALEQGREVFALPGRVSDALSDGCNRLIRQGAGAATCPEDILEYFYGPGSEEAGKCKRKAAEDPQKVHGKPGRTGMGEKPEKERLSDMHGQVVQQQTVQGENEEKRSVNHQCGEPENPGTLAGRVLCLLSTEDEKHIERILEELGGSDSLPGSAKAEGSVSLPDLVSCLMRLQIDGRVEESPAGYYRKI